MRLRYNNSLDDIVAFQRHHLAHSPFWKGEILLGRWGGAGILLILVALDGSTQSWIRVFVSLGVGVLWILIFPGLMWKSAKRSARKLYSESANKGLIGWHELEITNEELVERTEAGEQKTKWGAIERLRATPDYTFVYVTALTAHVIPRALILEGNYEAFVERLKERVSAI